VLTVAGVGAMAMLNASLPVLRVLRFPFTLIGLLPIASGLAIGFVAMHRFLVGEGTTLSPSAKPEELVVEGLFRFSRNPMYLGLSAAVAGTGLLFGTLTPCLVAAGFVLVIDRLYIPPEEEALSRRFGASYDRYRQTTPRWI
jgi:protein-S-isoprenylcysteine O-methyltransferase Ste14